MKKLVANHALDIDMLKELAEGTFWPWVVAAGPLATCSNGSGSLNDEPAESGTHRSTCRAPDPGMSDAVRTLAEVLSSP